MPEPPLHCAIWDELLVRKKRWLKGQGLSVMIAVVAEIINAAVFHGEHILRSVVSVVLAYLLLGALFTVWEIIQAARRVYYMRTKVIENLRNLLDHRDDDQVQRETAIRDQYQKKIRAMEYSAQVMESQFRRGTQDNKRATDRIENNLSMRILELQREIEALIEKQGR